MSLPVSYSCIENLFGNVFHHQGYQLVLHFGCLLYTSIVLIQNSKGGGLASGFSSSNQIMGVRKTTDFLEKETWTLAAVMVDFSIVSAYTIPSSTGKGGDVILEQAQQEEKKMCIRDRACSVLLRNRTAIWLSAFIRRYLCNAANWCRQRRRSPSRRSVSYTHLLQWLAHQWTWYCEFPHIAWTVLSSCRMQPSNQNPW